MGSGASVTSKTTCEFCSVQLLTIFSRKKCAKCPKIICSKCLRSTDSTISLRQKKLCPKCLLLATGNFTRRDLDPYTVKELRHFLIERDISTEGCREKNDLVELVLQTSSRHAPLNQEESEHSRHVELLRQGETTVGMSSPRDASSRDGDQEHSSEIHAAEVQEGMPDSRNQTSQVIIENVEDLQTTHRKGMTLDEIENESDLQTLTVRQLKELLVRNYVDYKGCCEKPELLDRVQRLWRQHRSKPEGADIDQVPTNELCKICMNAVIDCILLECGHMVTCTKCGKRLPECPICRCYVSRVVHVFRS